MSCDCNKNQTPEDVWNYIESARIEKQHTGIGIFRIPAPEKGILEYRSVQVPDLTLLECVKRAEHCNAFKWYPYGFTLEYAGASYQVNQGDDLEKLCHRGCFGRCKGLTGCGSDPCCFCHTHVCAK